MSSPSRWDRVPFSPNRWPFFYGWMIVFAAIVGILMSVPGQTIGVSVYTDSLLRILGLNRLQLSAMYMLGTLGSAMLLPKAGKLYDTLGARVMTPIAALGLGVTLVVLSYIERIVDWISRTIFVDSRIIALLATGICFLFLRFFGQGMLTMLPRNMAMKWFVRRRGLINGFFGLSVAFGFSTLTFLFNQLITEYGFEISLRYVAVLIAIVFSTFAWIFYRDTPEVFGLLPDGSDESSENRVHAKGVLEEGANLASARGYFEFWIYCIAPAFAALSITAVSFHIVSIFGTAGYSRSEAVGVYIPSAAMSATMTLFLGWLADRVRLRVILRLLCIGQLLFYAGLLGLQSDMGYWAIVFGMGLSQSTFGLLLGLSWPRLFGVVHLGELSGFSMAITVCGSAIGPLLFGLSYFYFQSYRLAEISLALAALFLAICAFRAKS